MIRIRRQLPTTAITISPPIPISDYFDQPYFYDLYFYW